MKFRILAHHVRWARDCHVQWWLRRCKCPVALCVSSHLRSGFYTEVMEDEIRVVRCGSDKVVWKQQHSEVVLRRIERYDESGEMEPHVLELDIPTEYLEC